MNFTADVASGCWLWRGAKDRNGYGRVGVPGVRRTMLAHRYVYEQANGAIPARHHLHHKCENPSCVNPAHMEPKEHLPHMFAHGRAKLTDEQAREVRESGARGVDLAEKFGISESLVSMIRAGTRRAVAA